ncbi:auxin-responsive protein SAUR72-like [Apium graveolens]|uniref:auxin-responsive protein SAUR72-like n=1 Tax=Apium graveolens TaxID=4045 RepID=UPI003D7B5AFA
MKKLIRRLSRVADSSQYTLLRSSTRSSTHSSTRPLSSNSFRSLKLRRSSGVPVGHLPVYVGEEMERFIVSAELLNHPIFIQLLNKSAQEYGYEQKGVLRIPCDVVDFEKVLEAMKVGEVSIDVQDLIGSISDEFEFL